MTATPRIKRNPWGRWPRRDLGPDVVAELRSDHDDEAAAQLESADPDARGRAAARLLGPAARGAVRRC